MTEAAKRLLPWLARLGGAQQVKRPPDSLQFSVDHFLYTKPRGDLPQIYFKPTKIYDVEIVSSEDGK